MTYPAAYCVKCKTHTDTLDRHTVLLENNSRALRGICPKCASEVYKFMPKKSESEPDAKVFSLTTSAAKAFCFKCQQWTKVMQVEGVVLRNGKNALKGECEHCFAEVYKILPDRLPGKAKEVRTADPQPEIRLRTKPAKAPRHRITLAPREQRVVRAKLYVKRDERPAYFTFFFLLAATALTAAYIALHY